MKRLLTALAALALLAAPVAAQAGDFGLGFYGRIGGGTADWEEEDGVHLDYDRDTSHAGFGMVLDTALAWRFPFNYRLSLGYEAIEHDPDRGPGGVTLRGLVIDQDFGLALVRTRPFRLWFGPELRFAFLRGEPDGADHDIDLVGVGFGPALGMNFNFGPALTMSWKAGYLATAYAGDGGRDEDDRDYTVDEGHYFLSLAFLFRSPGGWDEPPPRRR